MPMQDIPGIIISPILHVDLVVLLPMLAALNFGFRFTSPIIISVPDRVVHTHTLIIKLKQLDKYLNLRV